MQNDVTVKNIVSIKFKLFICSKLHYISRKRKGIQN